jgi:hypothetical protein
MLPTGLQLMKKDLKVDNKREVIGRKPSDNPGPINLISQTDNQTCGRFTFIHQESDSEEDDLWPISMPEVSEKFKEEKCVDAQTGLIIKRSVEKL